MVFAGAACVIDPETGLDDVRDVGITGGIIVSVDASSIRACDTINAEGTVLAPGFIRCTVTRNPVRGCFFRRWTE